MSFLSGVRRVPDAATAPVAPDTSAGTAGAERHRRLVWVIGAGYFLMLLLLADLTRPLRHDEVVYLSQTLLGAPEVYFEPHRARGMTIVLAPVGSWHAPVPIIRVWIAAVSALGLVMAFRPWASAAGAVGSAAAGLFAISWVPLYFGVEGYPNLLTALAAAAATGYLLRWRRDAHDGVALVGVAVAVAVAVLLRPFDGVFLGAIIVAVSLLRGPSAAVRPVVAVGSGGVVGILPWFVEAIVRFGGPLERLSGAAGQAADSEARNNLIQYLNLLEGPVRQVTADPVLTYRGLLLLVVGAVLVIVGCARPTRSWSARAARLGAVASGALLVPYLLLSGGINLRYLLPAYALAVVPVAAGGLVVWHAARRHGALRIGLAAAVVAFALWQAALVRGNVADIYELQLRGQLLGQALDAAATGDRCAFGSTRAFPEIQWHSGCVGTNLWADGPTLQCPERPVDLAALAADGYQVFAVVRPGEAEQSPLSDWPALPVETVTGEEWLVLERPASLGPDDPPTPADSGPSPCPPSIAPDTSDASLRLAPSTERQP